MTKLPEMSVSFTIVVPIMSVISPESVRVIFGSEYTLPGFVTVVPDVVIVISSLASA